MTELTEMFLGKPTKLAFDLSVTLFSIVTMWLYAVHLPSTRTPALTAANPPQGTFHGLDE